MIDKRSLLSKSDQMNADDFIVPIIFNVEKVEQHNVDGVKKIWLYLEGMGNRPFKMSLGMARGLVGAWGDDDDQWVGRLIQLYCEPTVKWGGNAVGGIRISAVSHIQNPFRFNLRLNRTQRAVITFQVLQQNIEADKPFIINHVIDDISNAKDNDAVDFIVNDIKANFPSNLEEIKQSVIEKRADLNK